MVQIGNFCQQSLDHIKEAFHLIYQTGKCILLYTPEYMSQPCIYKRVSELEKKVARLESIVVVSEKQEKND